MVFKQEEETPKETKVESIRSPDFKTFMASNKEAVKLITQMKEFKEKGLKLRGVTELAAALWTNRIDLSDKQVISEAKEIVSKMTGADKFEAILAKQFKLKSDVLPASKERKVA
ncbi:MAG: hypothetical protein AABX38_05830 [Candidatus Micrarchaeota archaeon]